MRKIKIVIAIIGVLMIAALISAYREGNKTIGNKEMSDPLSAINYLIEEGSKLNNEKAVEVITEKYKYIDVNYLNLKFGKSKVSQIVEVKDEKVLKAYKESELGKSTNAEEFKVFVGKEYYDENEDHYITRAFVVVRLEDNIGWLVDYWGQDSSLQEAFRGALNLK
ncbi:MAG: hypothetical protein AB6733_03580 [Clostridiaceae bacterium]